MVTSQGPKAQKRPETCLTRVCVKPPCGDRTRAVAAGVVDLELTGRATGTKCAPAEGLRCRAACRRLRATVFTEASASSCGACGACLAAMRKAPRRWKSSRSSSRRPRPREKSYHLFEHLRPTSQGLKCAKTDHVMTVFKGFTWLYGLK